jgi:ring-1,2-phenylacetyl-CoA epoxidase subunit PaaD
MINVASVWKLLEEIKDPEIPVVSLVEMGIVRDVSIAPDGAVTVKLTPTFSGCPALHTMKQDIVERLKVAGLDTVTIEMVYSPPWTSDWINDDAREKLRLYGLAPAPRHGGNFEVTLLDAVSCPYCTSTNTTLKNSFGPTLCRMIFYCNACQQPFEQFKPL